MSKLGREFAPSTGAIALQVDDVPAARELLKQRGVQFSGNTVDSGHCRQAYFQDADGNLSSSFTIATTPRPDTAILTRPITTSAPRAHHSEDHGHFGSIWDDPSTSFELLDRLID